MLLLEIFLTVRAWKNGWGPHALLPGGAALAFGLLLGAGFASTGATPASVWPVGFAVDLLMVGVLIAMVRRPPVAHAQEARNEIAVDATSAVSARP